VFCRVDLELEALKRRPVIRKGLDAAIEFYRASNIDQSQDRLLDSGWA
jgi:hypothetical protein